MSYYTKFTGQFDLDKTLTLEQFNTLTDFSEADHRHDELSGVPGIWCDWVPAKDGKSIRWNNRDGSFYNYTEWLEYLINHFLQPWGYIVNGSARWEGEETGDTGVIVVRENVVSQRADRDMLAQMREHIIDALTVDGAHHKQWYLWKMAELLGIENLESLEAEEGIAP